MVVIVTILELSPAMITAINAQANNPSSYDYFALSFEGSGNSDSKVTCYEDRTNVADVLANVLGLFGSALGARLGRKILTTFFMNQH